MVSSANKCNIDIHLLAALNWWESGGDQNAISSSGAVGLTQVMPRDGIAATFTCGNNPCFMNRPTIEELKDPQFNLDYGGCFLSSLVDEHELREGLRRYGGGYTYAQYADPITQIYYNLRPATP